MKKIIFLSAILLMAAACNNNYSSSQPNQNPPAIKADNISDTIMYGTYSTDGEAFSLDTQTKQAVKIGRIYPDLKQYKGLPSSVGGRTNNFAIASLDKAQFLVFSTVAAYGEGDPIITSRRTYKCDLAAKKCSSVSIPFNGVSCWAGFDSQKNIFYGTDCNLAGDSALTIYNANTKTIQKINPVGDPNNISSYGSFSLSPLLDKTIFISPNNNVDKKIKMYVYDNNSVGHPLKIIELPPVTETQSYAAVAYWFPDAKKILLTFERRLYTYDFESGNLTLLKELDAPPAGTSRIFNGANLTVSGKYIAYVMGDYPPSSTKQSLWVFDPANNITNKIFDLPQQNFFLIGDPNFKPY